MSKFQIGDKVKILANLNMDGRHYSDNYVGKTGTIHRFYEGRTNYLRVIIDGVHDEEDIDEESGYSLHENGLELISRGDIKVSEAR